MRKPTVSAERARRLQAKRTARTMRSREKAANRQKRMASEHMRWLAKQTTVVAPPETTNETP